jgi:hypothetical protein
MTLKHDYYAVAKELMNNVGIPSDEIFYFDGTPLETVFSLYFQFCQENLEIASEHFGIKPAKIFIRNNTSVNAFASHRNNYFIIGVNSGTLVNLYCFFDSKAELFETGSLSFLSPLNAALTETLDAPIFYLMQQICNQFTYYHELGHLIQRSSLLSSSIEEKYFAASSTYSQQKHVYELDADLYGAEHIAFHLLEFWKKQSVEQRTGENLSYLISIGAAAIFSYFLKLMEGYSEIYYAEHSHPHPLVRILYVIDCFIQTIEGNLQGQFKINSNQVLQTSFRIMDEMFKADGSNIITQFVQTFWQEKDRIKSFVDNEIIALVPTMPELAYNRVRSNAGNLY